MNFVSQIFFGVVITSFTGAIAMIGWSLLCRLFHGWNLPLLYHLLRFVCLLYVIPIGYILVQLFGPGGYLQSDKVWQMHFAQTGMTKRLMYVLSVTWMLMTLRYIAAYVNAIRKRKELYSYNIPEDRPEVLDEFSRIRNELHIRRNIRIYRNAKIPGALITGVFHPMILLSDCEYSREQLTVIFYHELMHYKQHDLFYKMCGVFVEAVWHLNMASDKLLTLLLEWSEFECDRGAIAAMRGELTAKRYFEVILELKQNMPKTPDGVIVFSMLCENQLRLERRIDYMKKYTETKKVAKGVTAALTFAFAMLSVTTAYAAGNQMAAAHDYIYKRTEVIAENKDMGGEELVEFFIPAEQDNSYTRIVEEQTGPGLIMPLLEENEMVVFENWKIDGGVRHVSDKIKLKAGQKVAVSSVVSPANITFWMGIMNSDGDVWCVTSTGTAAYTFEAETDDSYRVFVQNRGYSKITASGSFYYYTPDETEEPDTDK